MEFQLGTVVACDESGCSVRLVHSGETIQTAFSELVKDRIRIRQQQLVALNIAKQPPEISWRWNIGEVDAIAGNVVSVRRLDLPAGQTEDVTNPDGLAVTSGDVVFYAHGDDGVLVTHVVDGRPADLTSLEERYLPAAISFLTS